MRMLIILIIGVLNFSLPAPTFSTAPEQMSNYSSNYWVALKATAFEVLETKCNVCHQKRNKSKIFTLENMDGFAPKIYYQVFIKQRMPKGRDIKLSLEDRKSLENWIATLK